MDGGASEAMGINETVTLSGLTVGSHTIELLDVATNCEVSGYNPRSVVVPHVVTNTTTFNVACAAVSPVFDQ
jgi:methyl coenzyme M reductase beta subunit